MGIYHTYSAATKSKKNTTHNLIMQYNTQYIICSSYTCNHVMNMRFTTCLFLFLLLYMFLYNYSTKEKPNEN